VVTIAVISRFAAIVISLPAVRKQQKKSGWKMAKQTKTNTEKRRDFIRNSTRLSLVVGLGGLTGLVLPKTITGEWVWQIDPFECTQCGRCADECVMSPSAVKCVHAYDLCGYCDLCGGYFRPGVTNLSTGAENQLCPTSAILRKFIEEPFFEFTIDEELCIGCGKCVKGCSSFGNGSLHLQIRHDRCLNCNQCAIARKCPSNAIKRVPADKPYNIKGDFNKS
jgi:Na+-translocating ferredoxin:NAD+ oxidoreductase subunit B